MVEKEIIEGKFDVIERNLNFIRESYSNVSPEDLEIDYKSYQALKFSLFEIIEACIDIASHIISSKRMERADSYAELFRILGRNRVISRNLANKLSLMARFRNFLIHRYESVDARKVLEIVDKHLVDVEEFIVEIKNYLQRASLI